MSCERYKRYARGVDLTLVDVGSMVQFHTRNGEYFITKLMGGQWLVRGGDYFPFATVAVIPGSFDYGDFNKEFIELDMHVEIIPLEGNWKDKPIHTSRVRDVRTIS